MFINDLEYIFIFISMGEQPRGVLQTKIKLKIPFLSDYVSIKGNNSEKKKAPWEFMKECFFCLLWMLFSRSQCTHIFHP